MQAKLGKKAPFNKYSTVDGLRVVWGNPADPSTYPASESGAFDVVYDNNGKDMKSCQPMIDHFKVGRRTAWCGIPNWFTPSKLKSVDS